MPNFLSASKKYFFYWLGAVVVQQLIVASSTFWISKLIASITAGTPFVKFLILFLLSLSMPYIPGIVARVFVVRWQYKMLEAWIEDFTRAFRGSMDLWNDNQVKSQKEPYLVSESSKTLGEFSEYAYSAISSGLNVTLSLGVIIAMLDNSFLMAYFISTSVAVVFFLKYKSKIGSCAQEVQNSRASLTSVLSQAWDNITINNGLNFKFWKTEFNANFGKLRDNDQSLNNLNTLVAVALAYITLVPVVLLIIYKMTVNAHNTVYLASMVVVLPRLFMMLNLTYDTLRFASLWPTFRARLEALSNAVSVVPRSDIGVRISWGKLKFKIGDQEVFVGSTRDLLKLLSVPGRVTLRGDNGAGKSSLFAQVKMLLDECVFVLPAHHSLAFISLNNKGLSTGQKVKAQIAEISASDTWKILLLDEWAANLDSSNKIEISNQVDDIAKFKTVLEIVH